jgi:hypothetical protein
VSLLLRLAGASLLREPPKEHEKSDRFGPRSALQLRSWGIAVGCFAPLRICALVVMLAAAYFNSRTMHLLAAPALAYLVRLQRALWRVQR